MMALSTSLSDSADTGSSSSVARSAAHWSRLSAVRSEVFTFAPCRLPSFCGVPPSTAMLSRMAPLSATSSAALSTERISSSGSGVPFASHTSMVTMPPSRITAMCFESCAQTSSSEPSCGTRVMPKTRVNWCMSSGAPRIFSTGNSPALIFARILSRPFTSSAAAVSLSIGKPHSGITPNQLM